MIKPEVGLPKFTCPHCNALAQQTWALVCIENVAQMPTTLFDEERNAADRWINASSSELGTMQFGITNTAIRSRFDGFKASRCLACGRWAFWLRGNLLFPAVSAAPQPSADLTQEARAIYEEAARVLPVSPRAAAALLRLALEKLCAQLLGEADRIDKMIAKLVQQGIPVQIQKAMDVLRVTGNEALHPGTMDTIDNDASARALFGLVNLVVDVLITQPRLVSELYDNLPSSKLEAIERRDGPAKGN